MGVRARWVSWQSAIVGLTGPGQGNRHGQRISPVREWRAWRAPPAAADSRRRPPGRPPDRGRGRRAGAAGARPRAAAAGRRTAALRRAARPGADRPARAALPAHSGPRRTRHHARRAGQHAAVALAREPAHRPEALDAPVVEGRDRAGRSPGRPAERAPRRRRALGAAWADAHDGGRRGAGPGAIAAGRRRSAGGIRAGRVERGRGTRIGRHLGRG